MSKNAQTAFNYAVALAADLQASIHLVNVYIEQPSIYVHPERVFHSSFTQALEWNSTVPIWVLHDEDKAL